MLNKIGYKIGTATVGIAIVAIFAACSSKKTQPDTPPPAAQVSTDSTVATYPPPAPPPAPALQKVAGMGAVSSGRGR